MTAHLTDAELIDRITENFGIRCREGDMDELVRRYREATSAVLRDWYRAGYRAGWDAARYTCTCSGRPPSDDVKDSDE